MRRLRDVELEARIHKFLRRKFDEFPELARVDTGTTKTPKDRLRGIAYHRQIRWDAGLP